MSQINRIIIVGGGTAGWLTAGLLAATHSEPDKDGNKLTVTVVESDTVHPIGVGEGTWPTMRRTLSKIGIPEADLIKRAEQRLSKPVSLLTGTKTRSAMPIIIHSARPKALLI